jgi:hypothetical protein
MSDPIIEAAARALKIRMTYADDARVLAIAVLTAVAPLIRAAALEEAARAFEPDEDGHDSHSYRWTVEEIAAAIRALKEQP